VSNTNLDSRRLLARILETPNLARVVPRLPPEVLHRVIQSCGLEDCAELVALATPGQLTAVFDLDLWRPARPGLNENDQFDADRFGLWLEVMMESGETVAARKLADVDADLAIAGLAQHIRVLDPAAGVSADGITCDVGGYLLVARRSDSWDAIVGLLTSVASERPAYFHRVMRGCRGLSNSTPEIDGLDDLLPVDRQAMFDLAVSRERRREQQGYVSPAEARAFLQMSRGFRLEPDAPSPANPIVRAHFQAIESTTPMEPRREDSAQADSAIIQVLLDTGILPPQHRPLLHGDQSQPSRLTRIRSHMQFLLDRDEAAYWMRTQELAFLTNTLMAGCSVQARPFAALEASDAAVAACNLGLENWPRHVPEDFLAGHDLISLFQAGWTILHSDVCLYTAEQLIGVLGSARHEDRETQAGLDALRIELTRHCRDGAPWRARDAMDVMMILDMPAWATLLGLIDECPVIHAGLGASPGARTVSASAFEFISENTQVASVHAFVESLAETLAGQ
jgi:uncharacterized protein DUF6178